MYREAAGGEFRIGQRLLHGDPVVDLERSEDRLLLCAFEILDQVDDVVGLQFAHRLGQRLGRERCDPFGGLRMRMTMRVSYNCEPKRALIA